MMSELEKIPVTGDQVKIPAGFLTVTRMDGRRVDRVRFEPIEVEDE
jgi:CBS domain containing-hemolysin-like protein